MSPCDTEIPESEIRRIGGDAIADKFARFLARKADPGAVECPSCDALVAAQGERGPGEDEHARVCAACGTAFCARHALAHAGKTCASLRSTRGRKRAAVWRYLNTQKCPRCGDAVQRNGGCPQMTCRCGARFCWYCGRSGSSHAKGDLFSKCTSKVSIAYKTGAVVVAPAAAGVAVAGACVVAALAVVASPFIVGRKMLR